MFVKGIPLHEQSDFFRIDYLSQSATQGKENPLWDVQSGLMKGESQIRAITSYGERVGLKHLVRGGLCLMVLVLGSLHRQ